MMCSYSLLDKFASDMKIPLKYLIPLGIAVTGMVVAYFMITDNLSQRILPIIQPTDLKPEMVAKEALNRGIGHRIGKFSFLNQDGGKTTLATVKGKIFVAEYFFTTCNNICPIMNREMTKVQERFKGNPNVKILSFTVDPETDSVPVMKAYAEKHHAVDGQWYFLTGNKDSLYYLARHSFFVLKPDEVKQKDGSFSPFIHTNNFVLVDRHLRIRGYYDGTDSTEVDQLMADIQLLIDRGQ